MPFTFNPFTGNLDYYPDTSNLIGPVTITEAVGSSALTITGATQTASFPALSITQTWNGAGVTFTGVKVNVTNTASATASLLADLQTGGTSQFTVRRDGLVTTNGGVTIAAGSSLLWSGRGGISPSADGLFQFFTNGFATNVNLAVDASNVLAQRNSTNAQTFRIYNTYTDASNYERLTFGWSSNILTIGTDAAGTGTVRPLQLSANAVVNIDSGSQLKFRSFSGPNLVVVDAVNNTTTTGTGVAITPVASTATSGSNIAVSIARSWAPTATSTMTGVGLSILPTINYSAATPGAGSYEALKIAVTETALPTGTNYLIRASAGAAGTTDVFTVARNLTTGMTYGAIVMRDEGSGQLSVNRKYYMTVSAVLGLQIADSSYPLSWGTSIGSSDLMLFRDAANTLAQRNSTNAQTFNIYNTYTDASNYERLKIGWASNIARIGAANAGTGTARALALDYGGTTTAAISIPITSGTVTFGGGVTLADAGDLVFGTTTGTKFGTATTQKLGFWNATPIVQPTTAVAAAAFVANTSGIVDDSATFGGYTIGQIAAALKSIGVLA